MITFTVTGRPAPQGSKKYVGNNRFVEASKYLPAWRKAITSAAVTEMQRLNLETLDEACVLVAVVFILPPKTISTPYPTARIYGDTAKHARAIEDALVDAGVIVDDRLFVDEVVKKRWAIGVEPGAMISVMRKDL